MGLVENEFIKFMGRFDQCPFEMLVNDEKYLIGEGEPAFSVVFPNPDKPEKFFCISSKFQVQ